MDAQDFRSLQEAYMEVYQEQEEINVYNASLQYLINEGYAETLEEAQDIYLNLDEASKNTLSKAVGKLAWKATKAGAKLALKGAKTAVKAVRDYGGDYPIGSKRRAVSDTIDKVHWASLSDAERRKRTNAKHRARNTKKGHEEIMARNRRSQEVSDRWHEQQRKKQERKRAQTGRYRNAGAGSRESVREDYDLYDIILSHLLDEGYADTQQAAEAIMVNMSEEWRQSIIG